MKEKILIIGGSGFIGGHVADEFKKAKKDVTILDKNYLFYKSFNSFLSSRIRTRVWGFVRISSSSNIYTFCEDEDKKNYKKNCKNFSWIIIS